MMQGLTLIEVLISTLNVQRQGIVLNMVQAAGAT